MTEACDRSIRNLRPLRELPRANRPRAFGGPAVRSVLHSLRGSSRVAKSLSGEFDRASVPQDNLSVFDRAKRAGEAAMSETQLIRCPACGVVNRVPLDKVALGLTPVCGRCKTRMPVYSAPMNVTDATFAGRGCALAAAGTP